MKQQIVNAAWLYHISNCLSSSFIAQYSYKLKMNEMSTTSQNCRLLDAKWQLWENRRFIGNHIRFSNWKWDRIRGCTCIKILLIKSDKLCSCEFDKSIAEKIEITHVIEKDTFGHYKCCYFFWKSPCRPLWSTKSLLALTIHVQWTQQAYQSYPALLAAQDLSIRSV